MGLKSRIDNLLGPLILLSIAYTHVAYTFIWCLLTLRISSLTSVSTFRERSFATAFKTLDKSFKAAEAETMIPSLVKSAHGRVLEVGPGVGGQISRYNPANIEHIFGVESNKELSALLEPAAESSGLGGKYTAVPHGIEDLQALKSYGIREGSFDCILEIQVLCSVPQPREAIEALYRLLKPGGELLVYEHIRSEDLLYGLVQRLLNPVWSFALGGCTLGRPIDAWLVQAGKWKSVELEWITDENSGVLPRVGGKLIKAD